MGQYINDREQLKGVQIGHAGSNGLTDVVTTVKQCHYRPYVVSLTDGGTAGTNATEVAIPVQLKCKVVAIYITAPVAVTGDDTNNKVFTIAKRTAGGSATTIGTYTTSASPANSMTAFSPVTLTLTASAVELASGDCITVKAIKGGTGVAIGSATAAAYVTVVVEEN